MDRFIGRSRTLAVCRALVGAMMMMAALSTSGQADEYPSRPIRVVVPFSAGGVTDIVARVVFDRVTQVLGQQGVVENRVGAAGTLGMETVARAAPDGYTLVLVDPTGTSAANVTLYPKASFNLEIDLIPVASLGTTGAVLVVPNNVPVKTVTQMVAYSKTHKSEVTFGSVGVGTPGHLNVELLKMRTGIEGTHIPYRSIPQGMTDLISERITYWIPPIPTALPHIRNGKLRALAVSADARVSDLPDIPTFKELGINDYNVSTSYAVFAPKGTPKPIVDKLHAALAKALADEEVQARLRKVGVEPAIGSPTEVTATLKSNVKLWADVIETAGISIEQK